MKMRIFLSLRIIVAILLILVFSQEQNKSVTKHQKVSRNESNYEQLKNYGNLPLYFEVNEGQSEENVKFLSRGFEYSFLLSSNEAILSFSKPQKKEKYAEFETEISKNNSQLKPDKPTSHSLFMKFIEPNKEQ